MDTPRPSATPLQGLLKKLACHEKESALEDYFLSLLLPLIGRRSRRMRELKELCPHPSRPVGTPSPGEAGEGKDRFLSFLAFSTSPPEGIVLSFISPLQRGKYSGNAGRLGCVISISITAWSLPDSPSSPAPDRCRKDILNHPKRWNIAPALCALLSAHISSAP